MRITIEPTEDQTGRSLGATHIRVSIEHPSDDLPIHELFENIIAPALLAWGFGEKTINEYLNQ